MLGQVAGKVWATKKAPNLTGQAFLTVEVGDRLLVCADCVGAGEGEQVLIATGGAARIAAGAGGKNVPLQPSDVARVVSRASGIPAERVGEAERERLEQLEERLSAEVVGQPRAVKAVAAIVLGIVCIFELPQELFAIGRKKTKR